MKTTKKEIRTYLAKQELILKQASGGKLSKKFLHGLALQYTYEWVNKREKDYIPMKTIKTLL